MCVLNGFSRKNPLFFNLSGFCARIHCLGKFAKDSIALACYCTFWTFLIQRNKSGGRKNTHLRSKYALRLIVEVKTCYNK